MQRMSKAYKEEQKNALRNEQSVYVYLGIFSREAQANAQISGEYTDFSKPQGIFERIPFEAYYVTAEQNFARVDGSQYFMPHDKDALALYQGAVTQKFGDDIVISFDPYKELRIKGLTIDFGDYYPTLFMLSNGWAEYTYIYENDKPGIFTCDDEFLVSEYIWIVPFAMVGGNQRTRVLSIQFGKGFIFDNYSLISTSWKSKVAHLSDTLPSKTFSFTVDNLNRQFSADNPHSYVAFLQEQQEVEFEYGRKLDDGTVYRIPGGKLSLKSWTSNDMQAKFTAVGKMDYVSSKYNKGNFYPDGISLYDLADAICKDAGFTTYNIDTYLKKLKTKNPVPVEKHKALLQLIANAARAILYETRDGVIEIQTSFMPAVTGIKDNGHMPQSNIDTLLLKNPGTVEYASNERDFNYVDGHQRFISHNSSHWNAGYISKAVSDDEGYFTGNVEDFVRFVHSEGEIRGITFKSGTEDITNGFFKAANDYSINLNETGWNAPWVEITWEAKWTFYNLSLEFADVHPLELAVITFYNNNEIDNIVLECDSLNMLIEHDFMGIDKLVITFRKALPRQHVHLRRIKLGDITDFSIDYRDMSTSPLATKTDFVKNVVVTYSEYDYGTEDKVISTVSNVKEVNTAEYTTPYHNFYLTYKELADDDTHYGKVSKKFVTSLPAIDKASTNTRYFVVDGNSYKVYVVKTEEKLNSWQLLETVTQTIVDSLPLTIAEHVLYLVRTDTLLIYHCYIKDITSDNHPIVSLGYDVRGNLKIIDKSAYYVKFTTDVLSPIEIHGTAFLVTERSKTHSVNELGVDKTAKNVLIDSEDWAEQEAEWLMEYYSNDVEYKISYRGEPCLDPDDQIYIENKFVEKNLVRVTETAINTSQGMSTSCQLQARRISYVEAGEE